MSEKRALYESLGYLFKTTAYCTQFYYSVKERKRELIYLHGKYITEEMMEEARKVAENENCASCSKVLITLLIMLL